MTEEAVAKECDEIVENEILEEYFYVKESGIHGMGLFAKEDIPKGDYLGTYDGPEKHDDRDNGMHVLWVEDEDGSYVGRDGQNLLRYINHSAKPIAEFEGFDLYALRYIEKDTEITIDYGSDPATW